MAVLNLICKNLWCKCYFDVDIEEGEERPKQCPKCKSFDEELSGGVSWTDKTYEGSRFDGMPHRIAINIKKYYK